jgi:hypothetical protein
VALLPAPFFNGFDVLARYNLLEEKICGTFVSARLLLQAHAVAGHVVANLFAVILPWGVSLFVCACLPHNTRCISNRMSVK